jgi:hypothetical protein
MGSYYVHHNSSSSWYSLKIWRAVEGLSLRSSGLEGRVKLESKGCLLAELILAQDKSVFILLRSTDIRECNLF